MTSWLRLTLASGLATLLAASAIGPLFDSLEWLGYVLGCLAMITAAAALARRLAAPPGLVPLVNLVALSCYVSAVFGSGQLWGVLPTRTTLATLQDELLAARTDIGELAAPVPPHLGLFLIAVLCLGGVAVVVDALAMTLRRPALAGIPLLAVYAVPVGIEVDGLGWLTFTLGAIGYLVLLLADGRERMSRWGRPFALSDSGIGFVGAPGVVTGPTEGSREPDPIEAAPLTSSGRRIGAAAIGAGIIVPLLVPGLAVGGLAAAVNGSGVGFGAGSRTATVINPITQLKGELTRGKPIELLRLKTSDDQLYLRLTTLDEYQRNRGWTQSRLEASREQRVADRLPKPDIGSGIATQRVTATVQARGLDASQYLPLFPNPTRIDADGDWRYDARTDTVFSTRTNTRDLTYSFTAVEPRQGSALTAAMASSPDVPPDSAVAAIYEQTPQDTRIQNVVDHVTAGQTTPYGRTLAIYQYFRDPSNGFTYNLQTKAGNTGNDLLDFLQNKQGYCEQYASAMAIMVRYAGVPARVAIGYTRGIQKDGYRSVTTEDAHAWVEVYFDGVGWTTWDPTPPSSNGRALTATYAPIVPEPTPSTGGDFGSSGVPAAPQPGTSTGQDPRLQRLQNLDRLQDLRYGGGAAAANTAAPTASPAGHVGWLVLAGLILALILAPGLARPLLTRRRLARARGSDRVLAAHAAWDEVLATAQDVGLPHRGSESPRVTAQRLSRHGGLSTAALRALAELAGAEEQACYAPTVRVTGSLDRDAAAVRAALLRGASRWPALRARLLPPSTVAAMRQGAGSRLAVGLDWLDGSLGRAQRAVARRLARSG